MSLRDRDPGYGPLAALLGIVLVAVTATGIWTSYAEGRQKERANIFEARVEHLETDLEAARDSVLAETIEGFGLRCYFEKEENR